MANASCLATFFSCWDMVMLIQTFAFALQATKRAVSGQRWDYRWQPVPRKCNFIVLSSLVVVPLF